LRPGPICGKRHGQWFEHTATMLHRQVLERPTRLLISTSEQPAATKARTDWISLTVRIYEHMFAYGSDTNGALHSLCAGVVEWKTLEL
jgi:hypothetical protein